MTINVRILDVTYPDVKALAVPVLTIGEAQAAFGLIASGAAPVTAAALSRAEGREMGPHIYSLMAKLAEKYDGKAMVLKVKAMGYVLVARGDILAALFEAATDRIAQKAVTDRLLESADAVAGRLLHGDGQ